jgi:hypothetical protein
VVDGNLSVFANGVDVWDSNTGSWCSLQSFAMNGNNYMATGELRVQINEISTQPTPSPTSHHGGGSQADPFTNPSSTPNTQSTPQTSPNRTESNPYWFLPFLGIVIVIIVYLNYRRTH